MMDLTELVAHLRHAIHDLLINTNAEYCAHCDRLPTSVACDCGGRARATAAREDAQAALDRAADYGLGAPPLKAAKRRYLFASAFFGGFHMALALLAIWILYPSLVQESKTVAFVVVFALGMVSGKCNRWAAERAIIRESGPPPSKAAMVASNGKNGDGGRW